MPPSNTDARTIHSTETPKNDAAPAPKDDKGVGLYVIVADPAEGAQLVELHSEQSAHARYQALTYRGEDDGNGNFVGGGSHEIKPADVAVYKVNATQITF